MNFLIQSRKISNVFDSEWDFAYQPNDEMHSYLKRNESKHFWLCLFEVFLD